MFFFKGKLIRSIQIKFDRWRLRQVLSRRDLVLQQDWLLVSRVLLQRTESSLGRDLLEVFKWHVDRWKRRQSPGGPFGNLPPLSPVPPQYWAPTHLLPLRTWSPPWPWSHCNQKLTWVRRYHAYKATNAADSRPFYDWYKLHQQKWTFLAFLLDTCEKHLC